MNEFEVEVVYALPDRVVFRSVKLKSPATVGEALALSGMARDHPEIDFSANRVGVFGRRCGLETTIHAGDRVEIYRPLAADPKETRRRRAERARRLKKR